ncbi:arylamine N-acetyltransferase [Pseudonocardia yunnanensis]|uniref:Arylamine N-acetyltransferase n=1 Tax=Pseudonocardia yunnanensis TaxID=58107 RepID=A0ABW4F273_9PSEU
MTLTHDGAAPLTAAVDLAAYFRRIGLSGVEESAAPDRATLERIVVAHARSIAYENLDKFTGRDVHLDVAALCAKLVHGGRGGGCYENNMLLRHALDALGYHTTGLSGRVLWKLPEDAVMPRLGHMLVRVDLPEGPHLVDVGFGALTITGVLALEPHVEQATPHGPFRLLPDGPDYVMEGRTGEQWRRMFRFDLSEQLYPDYQMASWYSSHHPESMFVNELVIGLAGTGCQYTMSGGVSRGAELAVHHVDGPSERRRLDSPAAVRAALEKYFLIDLSGLPDLDVALTRLF